jgi:uncharacterized coiled-coil protein SlyX
MNDERISRLEVKVSHLEMALEEMSLALYAEQKKTERLDKFCRELTDRMKNLTEIIGEQPGGAHPSEERPPHY